MKPGFLSPQNTPQWALFRRPTSVLFVSMLLLVQMVVAEQYRIVSSNIDGGGGGVSSSVRFRVEGTVGKPSAGPLLIGLKYRLEGGIWTSPVEPELGEAPVLSIQWVDPNQIRIRWADVPGSWQLERRGISEGAAWKPVPGAIQAPVLLPSSDTAALFRLRSVP